MNTRESDFWNERSGPRIAPEYFGDIVATAADLAIVLSEGGTVVSVTRNPLNSALGQMDHWAGRKITEFLAPDSMRKVTRLLSAVTNGEADHPESIEVNHIDGAAWDFPIRYTMHLTGRDGRVLMLGRDLRPLAELQQRLVRAQLALEKDYESQRVFETRYRVLIEATTDAVALIDVTSGRIVDLNDAGARRLGGTHSTLVNAAFTQEFEGRRRAEFIEELCAAAQNDTSQPLRALLRRSAETICLHPTLFRNAGERMLLCRLSGEGDDPFRQGGSDPLLGKMSDLFHGAREAIVFTNADHQITQANDAFLSMMDVDSLSILRGRAMADLLARGSVDLRFVTDGNQIGAYETRLITHFGSHLAIEMTATPVGSDANRMEYAFVLREQGRNAIMRDAEDAGASGQTTGMANATALVGSAPLRDIVASMTDVVEKQCIEAAVELTNNNRVAAAEMLGLSRQSLYVKLRKYGLLQRDEP
ncbi:transcriptional regulator PpsR [Jannaschia sp. 2305UL9-9]|uniref:transcriptional regulator PpsR n=1 Tax=Jannaschia sp. 2305UL9-9 TaxID=3121638 RepID=UPI0035280ACB